MSLEAAAESQFKKKKLINKKNITHQHVLGIVDCQISNALFKTKEKQKERKKILDDQAVSTKQRVV